MRNVWMGLLLAGAAGCTNQSVTFEHQSELDTNTRGVALLDDGLHGQAGMYGLTCRINTADASIGEDYDFPSNSETVVDGGTIGTDPAVLVISEVGAHVTYPNRGWDWSTSEYDNPNLVDGAVYDSGIVVLVNDGSVQWVSGDQVATAPAAVDATVHGMTVTPSGTAFIGTTAGVISVDPSGSSTDVGAEADLLAWDDAAEVLYTAMSGTTTLSGIEADGTVRWTTELPGNITSLDAMGPLAQAAVMVEDASGTGELVTVDGFTGAITSSLTTPSAADDLVVSGNGHTMALVLPNEVHFFAVRGAP